MGDGGIGGAGMHGMPGMNANGAPGTNAPGISMGAPDSGGGYAYMTEDEYDDEDLG